MIVAIAMKQNEKGFWEGATLLNGEFLRADKSIVTREVFEKLLGDALDMKTIEAAGSVIINIQYPDKPNAK